MTQPIRIQSPPGIERDGTVLDSNAYTDARWCRFQRGLPKKMGGYAVVNEVADQRVYGMSTFSASGVNFVHMGTGSFFRQTQLDSNGNFIGAFDRTPLLGFNSDPQNMWQMAVLAESTGATTAEARILAHAAPNLDITSEIEREIWIGAVGGVAPMVDSTLTPVSGGIVAVGPYLVSFGNAGQVVWTAPNVPTANPIANYAWITPQKIVRGMELRGSGSGPSALLWSLDSLVRMTFANDPSIDWRFDTISSDISILSSQGVIEYDGIYYWAGVDRFLSFNGVVREMPNDMNQNWFFDNLNYAQRQKVFVFKVTRYGEIWWCYPRGNATECTHAVIFNVRYGIWYDTELPADGRTAGIYAKVFNRPLMVNAVPELVTGLYKLWQHEIGLNAIDGANQSAIESYFESKDISFLKAGEGGQAVDKSTLIERVEPDFNQSGQMSLIIKGQANSRSPEISSDPFLFEDNAVIPTAETLKLREIRRFLRFRFESHTLNGDYEMGYAIAHIGPADGRIES